MSIYLHPFAALLWFAYLILLWIVSWRASFHAGRRPQQMFVTYITILAAHQSVLFVLSALNWPVAYTFCYMTVAPSVEILAGLTISRVIWNVFRPSWGLRDLWLQQLLGPLALFSVIAFGLWMRHEHAEHNFLGAFLSFSRSMTVLYTGALIVASVVSDRTLIGWRTREYGIAAGFLLNGVGGIGLGTARLLLPKSVTPSLYAPELLLALGTTSVWLYYFYKPEPPLLRLSLEELLETKDKLLMSLREHATQ